MPIKFSNAHYYRIAGRYTFGGDLFIVRGAIYFFPEVDLSDQRNEVAAVMPHDLGLVVSTAVYLSQKASLFASSTVDLSRRGMSDEQFRKDADARIGELKWTRKSFGKSLPLPTRISADEISGMRLSRTGRLSLSAQSDNHDFNVGLRRRRRLRDALWEMGLRIG